MSDNVSASTASVIATSALSGNQYAGLVCRTSKSDAILPGWVENDLRLVCEGDDINSYINDELLASLTDARYDLNYGRNGIYTKTGCDPQADAIVFSDFEIRELR